MTLFPAVAQVFGMPSALIAFRSTVPSQSLSSASHISCEGLWFWLQTMAPPEQLVVPAAQTPGLPVLQDWPPPGLPSSVEPLQLLSSPSHISVPGCWFWLQTMAPPEQAVVPAAQMPNLPVLQA